VNLYGFVGNDGVGRWDFLGLEQLNLQYVIFDYDNVASDESLRERNLHRIRPEKNVANFDEIVKDVKDKVGKYDPDGKSCNCVKNLVIWTHSAGKGGIFLGGDQPTNALAHVDFTTDHQSFTQWQAIFSSANPSQSYQQWKAMYQGTGLMSQALRRVAKLRELVALMCPGGVLDLRVCYLGASDEGQKLKNDIEGEFDGTVKVYLEMISPGWVTDYVLSDGTIQKNRIGK